MIRSVRYAPLLCLFALFVVAGCADEKFMDRNVIASSVIKGEVVTPQDPLAKNVVLIVQNLEVVNKKVSLFGLCSGMIIGPRMILTAAHCLENGTESMKVVRSLDPRRELDQKTDVFSVIDKEIHPTYKSISKSKLTLHQKKRYPDLAILYLDRPLDQSTVAMDLSFDFSIPKDDSELALTLTGYGRTTALINPRNISFQDLNGKLRKTVSKVKSSKIKRTHFTTVQNFSHGICDGDSGGPVFLDIGGSSVLFALAIGTYKKGTAEPVKHANLYNSCAGKGVFINLKAYRSWLHDSVEALTRRSK